MSQEEKDLLVRFFKSVHVGNTAFYNVIQTAPFDVDRMTIMLAVTVDDELAEQLDQQYQKYVQSLLN